MQLTYTSKLDVMVCWVFFLAGEDISGSGGSGSGSPGNTGGLSTAQIVGIAVGGGVAVFLLLLVVIGIFAYW